MTITDQLYLEELCLELHGLCRRYHLSLALPPASGSESCDTLLITEEGKPQRVEAAPERLQALHIFQKTLQDMKFAMLRPHTPARRLVPEKIAPDVAEVLRLLSANGRIALYITVIPPDGQEIVATPPRVLHLDADGTLHASPIEFGELLNAVATVLTEERRQEEEEETELLRRESEME